jgi:hypothetical protein
MRNSPTDARARAGRQDHDAVAHRDGLVEVVRDEQHRLFLRAPQREHFVLHQLPRLDVQRRERFVHQDDVGVEHQRLREAHALAHAAGQLVRIAIGERGQADALQPLGRERARVRVARAAERQPGHHVAERGAPGHQALGLEHVARAPVDARQRLAEHAHAARARREQAGGHVQQRALAAAGRPDDGDELAGLDRERHVAHGGVARGVAVARDEGAADAVEAQRRNAHA